jgi:Uri superfamily endonuclease
MRLSDFIMMHRLLPAVLPSEKGTYALLMTLEEPAALQIGHLGYFSFPAGDYVYLGSAHGSGGLRARLLHHIGMGAQQNTVAPKNRILHTASFSEPHWHIDYLYRSAQMRGIIYAIDHPIAPRLECAWSNALASSPGAVIPVPGFGASDCVSDCPAHLIAFPSKLGSAPLALLLKEISLG